jgi:uncharacterized repeat protein (TIGR01451 family)
MAGFPSQPPLGPPGMENGVPLPYAPAGPWSPPGLEQPWPADEYLADGGDTFAPAGVNRNRQVVGLDTEDTIAQFDTLDGRTLVEPSNRVHLYSPRFLSVRQVVSLRENEQLDRTSGVYQPEKLVGQDDVQFVGSHKQNVQSVGQIGEKSVTIFRTRQGEAIASQAIGPRGFQDAFLPFENFRVLRTGTYEEAEMPFLAKSATAALAWERTEAVQIVLDSKVASAVMQSERVEVLYTVKEPPANPKLRVIKVASTQFAEPGDTVDFTIRFDNVGNQPIGNVAILDNLTARLEYVDQSAQASVNANFSSQPNEAGSRVLRWELAQPLQAGHGGLVRFRCLVR